MKKHEKLLRKLSPKDKKLVLSTIAALFASKTNMLDIVKLADNKYRLRKGNYRILFHYDASGEPGIDAIRRRNEGTYRDI